MQGQFQLQSAVVLGVEAKEVRVAVVVQDGLPGFTIVGMPDAAVRESQERVKSAIKACGFFFPNRKVVVNLAPASLRKAGSGLDLPIAAALLAATGQIAHDMASSYMMIGELSLDGSIRAVHGALPCAILARKLGLKFLFPKDTEDTIQLDGLQQYTIKRLSQLRDNDVLTFSHAVHNKPHKRIDFSDIQGHAGAKRALQIAAAGAHGVLMMGPPGSGKTMLASALPSILPPLDEESLLQAAVVHSVAGADVTDILAGQRPFRHPHHSISSVGLVGGGNPIKPGEISLAHHGVLFLDELAEFKPAALQALRQPMESGTIVITRANISTSLPAKFSLVAATNPCPCGYFGDPEHTCMCSQESIRRYQMRIGGPLLDRIDMHIDVMRLSSRDMFDTAPSTISSAILREGVLLAGEYRSWRISKEASEIEEQAGVHQQKSIATHAGIQKYLTQCHMNDATLAQFQQITHDQSLTTRAVVRILSVARTIADIDQSWDTSLEHIMEACAFRLRAGLQL